MTLAEGETKAARFRRRFPRAAAGVLVSVALGIVLSWWSDQSAVDEAVKRVSAMLYGPLLSETYPDTGRGIVAVVTVDDDDLAEMGLSWPVPLDFYGRMIDSLSAYGPRTIFFDIAFADQRPKETIDAFTDAACKAAQTGSRVYIVSASKTGYPSPTERALSQPQIDGRPCIRTVGAEVIVDRNDHRAWEYPLVSTNDAGAMVRSAALALAYDPIACDAPLQGECRSPAARLDACTRKGETCRPDHPAHLALIWGTRAPPEGPQLHRNAKSGAAYCIAEWSWWNLVPYRRQVLNALGYEQLPLCPYNQVIPARALMGSVLIFEDEELDPLLRNRYVLVGTDLRYHADRVNTPFHGRLPGVFLHAMALDNLISLRGEYRYPASEDFRFRTFAIALIVVMLTLWDALWPWASARAPGDPEQNRSKKGPTRRVVLFFDLLAGSALRGAKPFTRHRHDSRAGWFRHKFVTLLFYVGVAILVFYLAEWAQVGPLSLAEYIAFPLTAHFVGLGDVVVDRALLVWDATSRPEARAYLDSLDIDGADNSKGARTGR
jgi:hypothetical protein